MASTADLQLDQLDGMANEAFRRPRGAQRPCPPGQGRGQRAGVRAGVPARKVLRLGRSVFVIEAGLAVVNQTLKDNFIRPDESELAKARVKQKGHFRLIDKVDVRLVPSQDKFWAHLQNFNDRFVHIS